MQKLDQILIRYGLKRPRPNTKKIPLPNQKEIYQNHDWY